MPASPRLNILVLSPHRDDAAFSLALSLAAWRRTGHVVTLLNAFTRSIEAPFSDADSLHENDRLSYVSAMRKREDEAFLRQIPGLTVIDANIKDAPLRRHCPPESVYDDLPLDSEESTLFKIRKHLTRHLTQTNPVFVLPLALGHHIDHRIAREAAASLVADLPCAFYEDLPDAFREPEIPEQPGLTPVLTKDPNPLAWKRKAILLYSSQIETDTADRILDHARAQNDTERLWANESFARLNP